MYKLIRELRLDAALGLVIGDAVSTDENEALLPGRSANGDGEGLLLNGKPR